MFLTSLTTALAFLTNVISVIPPIRVFAAYMASIVFVRNATAVFGPTSLPLSSLLPVYPLRGLPFPIPRITLPDQLLHGGLHLPGADCDQDSLH